MKCLKFASAAFAAVMVLCVHGMSINGLDVSSGGDLQSLGWGYCGSVIELSSTTSSVFSYDIDSNDDVEIYRIGVKTYGCYYPEVFNISIKNGVFNEIFGMNRLDSNVTARVSVKISGGDFRCQYDPFVTTDGSSTDYAVVDSNTPLISCFKDSNTTVEITGGVFSFNPSEYVPNGVKVSFSDGRWHVGNSLRGEPELFNEEDDTPPEGNTTYNGWIRGDDGKIKGTIIIKTGKTGNGGVIKPTVTWTPNEGPKHTVKIPVDDYPTLENPVMEIPGIGTVNIGGTSISGIGVDIQAAADLSKNKVRKADYNARLARMAGAWTFALGTDQGYATFSVSVSKKGKGKLSGVLPDGTKVSATVQGSLGDSALAVPFAFGKKAPCGFVFWVKEDGSAELSDVSILRTAKAEFKVTDKVTPVSDHALADGKYIFVIGDGELCQGFEVVKGKWKLPKQNKRLGDEDPNPTGMKLTCTAKTGVVKGSFTVQLDKKVKYTVNGVLVGSAFYGSATAKGRESVPVYTMGLDL